MITLSFVWLIFCPIASGFTAVRHHDRGTRYESRRTSNRAEPEKDALKDEEDPPNDPNGMGVPSGVPDEQIGTTETDLSLSGFHLRNIWERILVTLSLGALLTALPLGMLKSGMTRRKLLQELDEKRAERVREKAKQFVQDKSTPKMWPSEYNGDLKGTVNHPYANISDEGTMIQYDPSKITTLTAVWQDADGIFFSYNLCVRIITNVTIGIGASVLMLLAFSDVADGGGDGKQEKWELDHLFKQLKTVSGVLQPALALFLSFYVSYMIARNKDYNSDAGGTVKGSIVHFNLLLASELPQAKHELLRKTALRWALCVWEDMFDMLRLSGDDYSQGKGLDELVNRGLLVEEEASYLKEKRSHSGGNAPAIITWLIGLSKELYNRKEISDNTHQMLLEKCVDMRGGVSTAWTLPTVQYPYLAVQFLNVVVNLVTTVDALKCGIELGGSIQVMRGAHWTMFFAELFIPGLTLILTPLFFYGALETGAKLDNPMLEGYGKNIHGVSRQGGHTAVRNVIENMNRATQWQTEAGSTFAKCFEA